MRLGYVVANDKAEYLVGFSPRSRVAPPQFLLWSEDPAHALVFPKRSVCRYLVKAFKRSGFSAWTLQFFETENTFFVGTQDRDRPAWLS